MESDNKATRTTMGSDQGEVDSPHAFQANAMRGGRCIACNRAFEAGNHFEPVLLPETPQEQAAWFLKLAYEALGLKLPFEDGNNSAERVARWLQSFGGEPPTVSAVKEVCAPVFEDGHDELVMVKDIRMIALCEHHLLPFAGKAAVGYIPNGKIVGLSKMARLVDLHTRRPTLQEHITVEVADALDMIIEPKGVMVVLYDTMHSCMTMRGIKDPEANTITSAVRGVFKDDPAARQEFLSFLKG